MFFLPTIVFALNLHTVFTTYDKSIDSKIRKEINSNTAEIMKNIITHNATALKKLLSHEGFKTLDQSQIEKIITTLKPIMQKYKFEVFREYYSVVKKIGTGNHFAILPENETDFIVNSAYIPGNTYLQFLISLNDGIQYLLYLQYIFEDEEWKLYALNIKDYAYQHQPTPDLLNKANELFLKNENLSAAIYALAANRLLRPADNLQYPKEKEYIDSIKNIIAKFNSVYKFPIPLKSCNQSSLYSIDYIVTKDGIIPLIKYITATNLKNVSDLKKEANKINDEINQLFPDMEKNFQYLVLQAYNKKPSDPKKQYNSYNHVFKNGKPI